MSATVPYTWYNVNSQNNALKLPGKTLRLSPGNYDSASELVTAVNSLLTADDSANPTISLHNNTMRSTIKITNDHALSGPLLELLGFTAETTLETGTHVSPNLVDVTGGVNSLLVYLSIIENSNVGSFLVPLLATIPLGDARPGDIITWTASGPDYEAHILNTRSFQTVEVDIRDTKGRSIDFNNYDLRIQIGIRKSQ